MQVKNEREVQIAKGSPGVWFRGNKGKKKGKAQHDMPLMMPSTAC